MQWPLNNLPGECAYESFIVLKGNTAEVRSRLVNARSDKNQYLGRHQELAAVYTNRPCYRLMTYRGPYDSRLQQSSNREVGLSAAVGLKVT